MFKNKIVLECFGSPNCLSLGCISSIRVSQHLAVGLALTNGFHATCILKPSRVMYEGLCNQTILQFGNC